METSRGLYTGLNPHLYAGVPQHAYAITKATASRPVLFTCHVATCLVVTLYDRKKKIGVLLHADVDVSATIRKIFEKLKNQGVQLNELEVQMIGGLRTGDEEEELARHNYRCIKQEILLKTPCIKEQLFENILLSEEDVIKISNTPEDITDEELDAALERWNKSRYTQIALDSLSGKVHISSDFEYNFHPLEKKSYSTKAQAWYKKLDVMIKSDDIDSVDTVKLSKFKMQRKTKNISKFKEVQRKYFSLYL